MPVDSTVSCVEAQAVPLGGKRIPVGMEDHADWEKLPIVSSGPDPNSPSRDSAAAAGAAMERALSKCPTYEVMMDMRNHMENSKRYLTSVSRNVAILSRASGISTDAPTTQKELPTPKPAVLRPQSMSLQNAKADMDDLKEKFQELENYKPRPLSNDPNLSKELFAKCKEIMSASADVLKEAVEMGGKYTTKPVAEISLPELSTQVTNQTRTLFQTKNKILNLIKEIKSEIAHKNNIPMNVPATAVTAPSA